nr:protein IQ-DOMAIN 32 [Ipomoea batatas]
MGRSTASCFKIIACGSDSVDRDELEASESKNSSDRRGWSFGKRSARHQVLSNTVISEPPSGDKDSAEFAGISNAPEKTPATQLSSFQDQEKAPEAQHQSKFPDKAYGTEPKSNIQEKTHVLEPDSNVSVKNSIIDCIDESKLTAPVDTKLLKVSATEADDSKANVTPEEQDVIVIQTAIRLFLAKKVLMKHKHVIKLQAAVRGHLVRRHAVGTLRCAQAIVKMQGLVRARYAHRCIQRDEKHEKNHHGSKISGKENSVGKPQVTYASIEKLLNNKFACQLLESSPRTKTINIKCDPSKSDSAWKWLERWMSVLPMESLNTEISGEKQEKKMLEQFDNFTESVAQSESDFESSDIRCGIETSAVPSESEDNLITYDADSLDFQAHQLASPSFSFKLEEPLPQDIGKTISRDNFSFLPVPFTETVMKPNIEYGSIPVKNETENKQQVNSLKRAAPEQPEGRTFSFGSRKPSNPAFIAAQSKFEELSSAANKAKVTSLSFQDTESCNYTISSTNNNTVREREINPVENSDAHSSVQVGGSECGTELSVTSTLDSPDRDDIGVHEFEQEVNSSMDTSIHHHNSNENLDIDANNQSFKGVDMAPSDSVQPERPDSSKEDNGHTDTVVAQDLPEELTPERNATDVQTGQGSETGSKVCKSTEASPTSHVTAPESESKSFAQASIKNKIKSEKSGSNPKHGSSSAGERVLSNSNHDAGTNSSEQSSKDHKSGKRQSSFGSTKSDNVDEEPRDSSSSSSLPSYMQATKSARAKAVSNSSPRSSPDAHNKDAYIKKRHSLSGSNGRQGSPRIQRSLSQAQPGAKGNGTHSPHERKWQR